MRPIAILLSPLPTVLLLSAWLPAVAAPPAQVRSDQAEFEQIAQLLEVSSGTVVADVGAGGGSWTFRLANRVAPRGHVFATDVRSIQVEGIRRSARDRNLRNVTVILGSQDDMGLPAACCEALLLRLVYHAFDNPARMRDSMRRGVKMRGRLLVIDFRPSPEQLTREMEEAGFERVHFIERWQNQPDVFAVLFRKVLP